MQILPNGLCQFIDSSGAPLASGTVGFYAPGTLNPLTTFQDQAGTIPNANPVPLNSRGQALIWGSGIYRQILKDASGVTIWDALTQSSDAAFSGSTGASLIGFDGTNLAAQLQARINRVVDSIAALRALSKATYTRAFVTGYYAPHDGGGGAYQYDSADTTTADNNGTVIVAADGGRWKLQQTTPISVKQFGAKGDGATDDTTSFNLAFAGMGSGTLYVPPGTFIVSSNITIGANQFLQGAGQSATIISATSLVGNTILMPNPNSGISNLTVTGLVTRTLGRHIFVTAGSGPVYVNDVTITNYFVGIELNGTGHFLNNIVINNTVSSSPASYGITITGGNDQYINNVIVNNTVGLQPGAGLSIISCAGSWVTNCDFIHCQNGVLIAPSGSGSVTFMFFANVACDTSTNNGWNLVTAGTAVIRDCAFDQCWAASSTNTGFLAQGAGGRVTGLHFTNFRAYNNGTDGLFFQSQVGQVTFTGGAVTGNSQTTPGAANGIHIGPNLNDFSISGALVGVVDGFTDSQLAQIQVDAGTGNRIAITGCNLTTTRTPVTMLASGSNNTITACGGPILKGHVNATTDAAGHVTVTHNLGTAPTTILATVLNDGAAIFVQASGTTTTTNFQLKFFGSGGAALVSTAVSFNWQADF